ncbi:hypothetical protein COCMIDRAFT_92231 [Bipolaris oryzae ATCC 44560]|uniref:cyclic pyranopterin monophosphate synthase n=1 Tax=Bipolaris oryzae ATCC 44560 TaxID=930090 RepID=W6ZA13_COCMI|nr:uncharacterized protein COCMIDRAFT_92231 [Bipolaris oryzae ATCC 44560]EUC46618.1 hypothetical protein COCMIDRAFT_92231 [Bipolaris oryzae ATCC 44560]
MPRLHFTALQSANTVRTFSTSKPLAAKTKSKSKSKNKHIKVRVKHGFEYQEKSEYVARFGPQRATLPPNLEEVRQKYGLTDEKYDMYWKVVADTKLKSGSGKNYRFLNKKAHSRLLSALQGSEEVSHRLLMSDAQSIADRTRQNLAEHSEDAMLRRQTQEMNELKAFLEEIMIPSKIQRALKKTEDKIYELQDRVTQRKQKLAEQRITKKWGGVTIDSVKQVQEVDEINQLLDTYKQQVDKIREQVQRLEEIRTRKEELLARKRLLLKQLEEQENQEREAKRIPKPVDTNDQKNQPAPKSLDSILNQAVQRVGKGWGEPQLQSTGPDSEIIRATAQANERTALKIRKPGIGSISVLTRSKPEDQDQDTKGKDMNPATFTASRPSDSLRLQVPTSGFIPIDENLIVTFEGSVPELQSYVFEMAQRLKSSYPRLDTLPYDVWTSQNIATLQTWLKIMVKKWQTRFDSIGQVEKDIMDGRVQAVLDRMVRDHDLSNQAAERMAVRWHQAFENRGTMHGDAEGLMNWDEFQAEGLGFLTNETESEVPSQQGQAEARPIPATLSSTDKRPTLHGDLGSQVSHDSSARRMYSTSSRSTPPARDLASQQKEKEKDDVEESPAPYLPHLTLSGSAHMVSVSAKQHTIRTAIAIGSVHFTNPTPLSLIRSNTAKKGDVLGVSRIAGIMAAKKCPDLIPLCHPIPLTHVGVELAPFSDGHGGVKIEAKVQCTGQTGVEMEALTAVMGAALSVVDMCKAVDRFQRVDGVRVVFKEGGKSGVWREEGWVSWQG